MNDKSIMPFGKHKDSKLEDVPADYLLWVADQDWATKYEDLLDYIEEKREELNAEAGWR